MIVSLGEALIDFLATDADNFRRQAGGAPLNVACGVARLGMRAAFVGSLGKDPFGDFLVDVAKRNRVEVDGIVRTRIAKTGLAFVTLDDKGDRSFTFYRDPSADMLLSEADLPRTIERCSVLHHGSITLIQSPSREATLTAVKRARAGGAIISYDPNLRPALWPSLDAARDTIRQTMGGADVVKVSQEELVFLADGDPQRILATGARVVVVTDGPRGATLHRAKGDALHAPAPAVDVVDTTGAGDAFIAAFLTRIVERKARLEDDAALQDALLWGVCAGALCCTGKGAIDPLPTRAQVEALIAAGSPPAPPST